MLVLLFPTKLQAAEYKLTGEFLAEKDSVLLSWDNIEQAGSFEIERTITDEDDWETVGTSKSSTYADFYFQPETAYTYRVRTFGGSDYSNQFNIVTPKFVANVNKEETFISDVTGIFVLNFPEKNTRDPLYVLIENNTGNISMPSGKKQISDIYDVRIKNSQGQKIDKLDSQITLTANYRNLTIKGVKEETIKLISTNGEKSQIMPTSQNQTRMQIVTLANEFSNPLFFLMADRISPWVLVMKIALWILLVLGVAFGAFLIYRSIQLKKYQEEHKDDFIYRH